MKKIKHILGINAHWTINKELSKTIGLYETILLQHLIDLQESFFEDGGFYQQDERLLKDLPFSIHHLKQARSILKQKELITVKSKGLPAKNHYTVNVDDVLKLIGLKYIDEDLASQSPGTSLGGHQNLGNTNNKNNSNNKDSKSGDEILLDKIIETYPGNINAKAPLLKALKSLSKEEKILAVKNIERYKKAANGFYLNLRNYIESKAFSEVELKKKEDINKLKNQKQNDTTNNASTFTNRDADFY